MQFSQVFLVAAAIATATAAPTGDLEARTSGGIQCQKHEGKWKYGWEGAAPSEKYTCSTSGLIVSIEFSAPKAIFMVQPNAVMIRTSSPASMSSMATLSTSTFSASLVSEVLGLGHMHCVPLPPDGSYGVDA